MALLEYLKLSFETKFYEIDLFWHKEYILSQKIKIEIKFLYIFFRLTPLISFAILVDIVNNRSA